jgi:hypothetical protein
MPYSAVGNFCNVNMHQIIICKWELNGIDYYDTFNNALSGCISIGYGLWSTGWLSCFSATDQAMIRKYISSSFCGKYIYFIKLNFFL